MSDFPSPLDSFLPPPGLTPDAAPAIPNEDFIQRLVDVALDPTQKASLEVLLTFVYDISGEQKSSTVSIADGVNVVRLGDTEDVCTVIAILTHVFGTAIDRACRTSMLRGQELGFQQGRSAALCHLFSEAKVAGNHAVCEAVWAQMNNDQKHATNAERLGQERRAAEPEEGFTPGQSLPGGEW